MVSRSYAQSTPPRPAFEVASVKPGVNCDAGGLPISVSPGRVDFRCITLRALIRDAYSGFVGGNLNSRLLEVVGEPHWIDSDHYAISARAERGASGPQMMGPMLQALLEERFQVKVHMGSQEGSVYALTVLRSNPKLRLSKEGSCVAPDFNNTPTPGVKPSEPAAKYCGLGGPTKRDGAIFITDWYGTTMAELAGRLIGSEVDRPVIDRTGLTGRYDIHLEFVHDMTRFGLPAAPDDSGPLIYSALESQLGLKLTPTKAPMDVIIVDQAEKPSEN